MNYYYILALLAALCWAIASLISVDVARKLGGLGFNRIRLIIVSIMLIIYTIFIDSWITIKIDYLIPILVSGFIGIFIGDTFLFIALQKIGPRRNNILFALAAPFTIILNVFFLKYIMSPLQFFGCFLVFVGVIIAIAYGTSKINNHRWEIVEGSLKIGILLGVLAALSQAIGLVIMKPILDQGADPIASAAIRTTISALCLSLTYFSKNPILNNRIKYNLSIIIKITISGFLGMALGMSLLLISLQNADAGIVATLSSTSPIIILFLIWFLTSKVPTLGAWVGTSVAVLGTMLIFI